VPFTCPLCGSDGYVAIHVQRPSSNWYRTPFYSCFGCRVMFDDPQLFSRQRKVIRDPNATGGAHKNYPRRKDD
jgi:hypothetical protein